MSQHQAGLSRGRPAILAFHDLGIGPAYTHGDRFNENGAVTRIRFGDFFIAGGSGFQGFYCNCLHDLLSKVKT